MVSSTGKASERDWESGSLLRSRRRPFTQGALLERDMATGAGTKVKKDLRHEHCPALSLLGGGTEL